MAKLKRKMSEDLLKWRAGKRRGEIMKPATFEKIKESAARSGATNPEAVAGRAYWAVAKKKYKESRLKRKK